MAETILIIGLALLATRPGVGVFVMLVWLVLYASGRQRSNKSGVRSAREIYDNE